MGSLDKGRGSVSMTNTEVAGVFRDIAELLKLKKENIFKVTAYQKAARSIEELSVEVERLVAEDKLKEVPGVGEAIYQENYRAGNNRAPWLLREAEG